MHCVIRSAKRIIIESNIFLSTDNWTNAKLLSNRIQWISQDYCSRLTYSILTPCDRVLIEKLTGSQLVKKFPAFYRTRVFIIAFTPVRQLSLSWVSSIQSIPPHPTSWRSILILSSHLCLRLPSGLSLSQVSPPKPSIQLSSLPYAIRVSPTPFFSI
jgi:hypothetical protein